MRKALTLRGRILLFASVMLLPAAGTLIYSSYRMVILSEASAISEAGRVALSIVSAQRRTFESGEHFLDAISQMPQVKALNQELCQPILIDLNERAPRYAAMGVFLPNGEMVCRGERSTEPNSAADRSWFRRAVETKGFAVGDYQIGMKSGRPSVGLAKPLLGADGRIVAIIYVSLDLNWISEHVVTNSLPAGGVFVMMDREGTVLARYPNPENWIGKKLPDSLLFARLASAQPEEAVEIAGLDGKQRLFHLFNLRSDVRSAEVYAAVGLPIDNVREQINKDLLLNLTALIAFGAVALTIVYFLSEHLLSRPLRHLIAFSKKLSTGELSGRSGIDHDLGELGALAANLEEMAASLSHSQRELENSHRLLVESQETGHIGSWEWKIDEPMMRCTPELRRIFRLEDSGDQVPLNALIDRVHPDDRESCVQASKQVAEGRPRNEIEFRLLLPDGEVRHCWSAIWKSIPDNLNDNGSVRGITQDITERKITELERDRYSQFVQVMLNNIADGILACDRTGRLVVFNHALEKLYGVRADEVPLEGWMGAFSVFTADGNTRLSEEQLPLKRALQGERVSNEEFVLKPTNAPAITVLVNAEQIFDVHGEKLGAVVTVRDMTAQRVIEATLRQSQKVEAVGQLTGGIAHDFNNLLSIIIGNLDSLLLRIKTPEEQELLNEALNGALRGAELTKQMLAFARQQQLNPGPIDIGLLLQGCTGMLKRMLGEDIVVRIALADDLWKGVADQSQLETSVINLAINGRDAMERGGTLTVEARNAHIDEEYAALNPGVSPGDYVKISITDTGAGMAEEVLTRVLEPFFTTKQPGKGTGLGLSMVYGFAKQSGGHLKIYSEVGHGTTVNLYLPRYIGNDVGDLRQLSVVSRRTEGKETILVVDDNRGVRKSAVTTLTELGYRVVEAEDVANAEMILKNGEPIDLVFSDVVMPGGKSGFDLAEFVTQHYKSTKILLVTGFAESAARHQGRMAKDVQLMAKPYRRQDLAGRIRDLLDSVD